MRRIGILAFLLQSMALLSNAQLHFDDYFITKTLRVNFFLGGDASQENVFFESMKEEPIWGGPVSNLLDPFGYGAYHVKVYDATTNVLIFSKGFSSLFEEWRSTAEAKEMKRAFYQVVVIPYPKKNIRFVVESRQYETGEYKVLFEKLIDPADYFIRKEEPLQCRYTRVTGNSQPSGSLDIAVIAEGYKENEMDKFRGDVKRIMGYIMSKDPYKQYQDRINIYALESASQSSGTDVPGEGIYANTIANTSYYTFNIDRYLTTFDTKILYDIAANVPYDQVFVLINTNRYGGGGFYNYYTGCTADHNLSFKVAAHEFGHGFAGLGDEYYESEVAYSDYYNLTVEPWEPNLTTSVDFSSKWKDLVLKSTPLPTPREKENANLVGLFEGGGYVSKGVYSPTMDCIMKSNTPEEFCPVCQRAIRQKILFYLDLPLERYPTAPDNKKVP